ncbi:glutathione S-transferase [Rhizophagus irregularis]|uniref:Glutathione S-transferase n=1 Tax=Rhizophagus irregularis TaxID=588596 RepID=A0A2N0QPD9_9GLOM|nr:glutathione S-transferase [Rhizophagus irregularis]
MTTPDITFYTAKSPNGVKVSIVLEELGIPYKAREISIKDEHKQPWFLNVVFESGAIMIYLCEHYDPEGKLMPKDPNLKRQAAFFNRYGPEKIPYAIKRYTDETKRLYSVLNGALESKEYLVGNKFTLADAINFSWVRVHFLSGIESIDEFPNLKAWVARISARPAVQKGLNVPVPDKLQELMDNPEILDEFVKNVRSIFKWNLTDEK